LCEEFVLFMYDEFEMSIVGEGTYFLGLQIKQMTHGTFLCQSKYCTNLLKKFEMENYKEVTTPMSTKCYLDSHEK